MPAQFKAKTFLLLLLFVNPKFHAQNTFVKDSIQLMKLYNASGAQLERNPKVVIGYASQMQLISEKKKYPRGLVWAYYAYAAAYDKMGNYKNAVLYSKKAIDLANKHNYLPELTKCNFYLAGYHIGFQNYDKAFDAAIKAFNITQKTNDSLMMGRSYSVLAECYYFKNDIGKAIAYNEKSVVLLRKIKSYKYLGRTLVSLGTTKIFAKKYTSALGNFNEALQLAKANPKSDPTVFPKLYGNMALCYDEMGQDSKAELFYLKTLEEANKFNMLNVQIVTLDNLGEFYTEHKKYDLAEKTLNKALAGAVQTNTAEDLMSINGHLSALYAVRDDYKKAYGYQKQYMIYSDSVMNQEKMATMENLSVKFQTKEMDTQNKVLQKENALQKLRVEQAVSDKRNLLIGSILIALLLLFAILYFRQKNITSHNSNNELKRKLLLMQMNPHFIFNSLQNIAALFRQQEEKQALDSLSRFSKLTRQILENSMEDYISLYEELEMTTNYLVLQQQLYDNKFQFSIATDPNLDTQSILIPPMLTQPFIENAVKHGLRNTVQGGQIEVKFYMKDNRLYFEVTDNGAGIQQKGQDEKHKSVATKIVADRLKRISGKNSIAIYMSDIDGSSGAKGVKACFEIPFVQES